MTFLWTFRAAEPTAAFPPQRKCKTVQFKSSPRNQKAVLFQSGFIFAVFPTEGLSLRANNLKGEAEVNDSPADCQTGSILFIWLCTFYMLKS